jgi:Xaa-Pro aminopeptidase
MQHHRFNQQVYAARRKALMGSINKGIILLTGNDESPMNYADNCYHFRQDSTFLYYTGIDQPMLALVLDVETGNEILFGNDGSIDDIVWTGPLPSVKDFADMSGIATTKTYHELDAFLKSMLQIETPVHILPPYRAETKIKLSHWFNCAITALHQYVSVNLIKAVVAQREIKDELEVAEIDKAVTISNNMHLAAMQYAKPGMKEYELVAKVQEVALASDGSISYPVILTVNGQTLHNHFHHNTMREGQMVLVDAGAENNMHYAGDITRTFPVGKKFTERQKHIYNTVLHSLQHAELMLKEGVYFREVHAAASIKLLDGLKEAGIVKGNTTDAMHAGVHTLFFQCGLGHMMGLDVHDMEDLGENFVGYSDDVKRNPAFGWKSLRLAKQLKTGFVLTVEPGIYIIPELIDRWKAENKLAEFVNYEELENYRHFSGIRLENNYLITNDGYKKLGSYLPLNANEIEALRS